MVLHAIGAVMTSGGLVPVGFAFWRRVSSGRRFFLYTLLTAVISGVGFALTLMAMGRAAAVLMALELAAVGAAGFLVTFDLQLRRPRVWRISAVVAIVVGVSSFIWGLQP